MSENVKKFDPADISTGQLHSYLLGAVGPRPIALASTVDKDGNRNLSPFSFFNVFSANPPIAIFSPARRGRDNTTKHTFENIKEVREVVINVVNYDIVQQVSLASTEYEKGVDEFIKAGLTPLPSEKISPSRVAESPVQFECIVKNIIELGQEGGAGNLIIAEIVMLYINEAILDADGKIDQRKIDLVGRMGGNWYTRANLGLFEVEKPLTTIGIGVDKIPAHIRSSDILSGNDLGKLGNVQALPDVKEVAAFMTPAMRSLIENADSEDRRAIIHREAKNLLSDGKVMEAWMLLLAEDMG